MKSILFMFIIFLFLGCSPKEDGIPPEIKILPKDKSEKILENDKQEKPNLKVKKVENNVLIKNNKGKSLQIGANTYKTLEKNLESKNVKEKESIKNTLDDLEFLQYKKNIVKKLNKGNYKDSEEIKLNVTDKMRAIFKPLVNKYSLRHLKFKNKGDTLVLDTISIRYENEKKRISLEVLPLTLKPLVFIENGQKDFFYKNYKLNSILIHLSVNYKLKLINGVFNHLGYTWVINAQNIDEISDVIDVIRDINFNLFMELKAKYEEE